MSAYSHELPQVKHGLFSPCDTPELIEVLRTNWMTSDWLCSQRLKAVLSLWPPHYGTSFHPLPAGLHNLPGAISAANIDRFSNPFIPGTGVTAYQAKPPEYC